MLLSCSCANVSTRENARRCGKWLVAARTSSCFSTSIFRTSAPVDCHIRVSTLTASDEDSAKGVKITLCCSNRVSSAASTPLFSEPAIGCPGTNPVGNDEKTRFAAATTFAFVLPTSVISVSSAMNGAMSPSTFSIAFTGTAKTIRSACSTASARLSAAISITPICRPF